MQTFIEEVLYSTSLIDAVEEEQNSADVAPSLPPLPPNQLDVAVQVLMGVVSLGVGSLTVG